MLTRILLAAAIVVSVTCSPSNSSGGSSESVENGQGKTPAPQMASGLAISPRTVAWPVNTSAVPALKSTCQNLWVRAALWRISMAMVAWMSTS